MNQLYKRGKKKTLEKGILRVNKLNKTRITIKITRKSIFRKKLNQVMIQNLFWYISSTNPKKQPRNTSICAVTNQQTQNLTTILIH